MKISTILGARPQFIKVGVVSREIGNWNNSNLSFGKEKTNTTILHQSTNLYGGGKASAKIIEELLSYE